MSGKSDYEWEIKEPRCLPQGLLPLYVKLFYFVWTATSNRGSYSKMNKLSLFLPLSPPLQLSLSLSIFLSIHLLFLHPFHRIFLIVLFPFFNLPFIPIRIAVPLMSPFLTLYSFPSRHVMATRLSTKTEGRQKKWERSNRDRETQKEVERERGRKKLNVL